MLWFGDMQRVPQVTEKYSRVLSFEKYTSCGANPTKNHFTQAQLVTNNLLKYFKLNQIHTG